MKAKIFTFVRGLKNGTPPRFQSYLKSLTLILTLLLSVNVWGEDVTIASWGAVSMAANTNVAASSYQGTTAPQMKSDKAMTSSATNAYYGGSAGGATITISGLPSGYKTKSVTFYSRASQGGNFAVSYSTNSGTSYTSAGTSSDISTSGTPKAYTVTFSSAVSDVTNIKFAHSKTSGSLYFGTVTVTGEAAATDPCTVTFDGNGHGTPGSTEIEEASAGAGVTLPSCDPSSDDYVFDGWATTQAKANAGDADAGAAGAKYEPSADITLYAVYKYNVKWSVNGSVKETVAYKVGANLSLPTVTPTTFDCDEVKVFAGWSANPIMVETNTPPSDLFTAASGTVTAPKTYYAVFADASTEGGSTTSVCDFEQETNDDWTIDEAIARTTGQGTGSPASYAGKINTNNTYVTFKEKVKVTEFGFSFKRTSTNSNYNVYVETSTDNSNWSAHATYSMGDFNNGSYTTKNDDTFDGETALYVRFHCYNTTATRYVDDISITYTGGITYSNYTTSCGAPSDTRTEVNMTSFSVTTNSIVKGSTTNTTVTNDQTGWTAVYTYSSNNTSIATVDADGVITAVAKGSAIITATLNVADDDQTYKAGTTKSKSIEITVTNPLHTATFTANSSTFGTPEQVEEGESITFPTSKPEDIFGKTFMGWVETPIEGTQATAPTYVTSQNMGTKDVIFYAVFANGSSTPTNYTLTMVGSNFGTSYDGKDKTLTAKQDDDDSKTMQVVIGTSNIMKSSNSGNPIQMKSSSAYLYNKTSLGSITSVTINGANGLSTYYGNAEHPTSGTTTGTPFFTVDNGSGSTKYPTSIVVNFTIESSSYSDYCTTVDVSAPVIKVNTTLDLDENAHENGSIGVQWTNIPTGEDYRDITLYSDESCETKFDADWFAAEFDGDNVKYTIEQNTEHTERVVYVQLYGVDGTYEKAVTKVIKVTQADAPYSTIPDIFTLATETEQQAKIKIEDWVVTGVKGDNAYVSDGNGNGLIIYASGHGFVAGNIISGAITAKVVLYKGAAEIKGVTKSTTGISVTTGGSIETKAYTIDKLSGVNTGAIVSIANVTYTLDGLFTDGANNIKPYNTFITLPELTAQSQYNIQGVYIQFEGTKEIAPLTDNDFQEIVAQKYTITIADDIENGTVTTNPATEAIEEAKIIVIATPDNLYKLGEITITKTYGGASIDVLTDEDGKPYFIMPAEAVTVSATFTPKAQYSFTWHVNGLADTQTSIYEGDVLPLPTDPIAPEGYIFVGWSTDPKETADDNAPALLAKDTRPTEGDEFYAVFAVATETGTGATETLTISSYATANSWSNGNVYKTAETSNVTYVGKHDDNNTSDNNCKYYLSGNTWRFYKGGTGTYAYEKGELTIETKNKAFISKIVFAGTIKLQTPSDWSVNDASTDFTSNGKYNKVTFVNSAEENTQITSIAVTYGGALSLSGYTTKPVAKEIEAIAVLTAPSKVDYFVGDKFDPAGLVLTLNYTDKTTGTVTYNETTMAGFSFNPDLNTDLQTSNTSVTITYAEKETAQLISVIEAPTFEEKTSFASGDNQGVNKLKADGGVITYEPKQGKATTAPAINSSCLRLYQNGGYIALAAAKGCKIDEVEIKTGATYNQTTIGYSKTEETLATTGDVVSKNSTWTTGKNQDADSIFVICLGTDKNSRLDIAELRVYYTGTPLVLNDITLSGEYQTEFEYNEPFNHDKLVVTANYNDGSHLDVTSKATVSEPTMTTVGQQTITVTFEEQEVTYNITIKEQSPYATMYTSNVTVGTDVVKLTFDDEVDDTEYPAVKKGTSSASQSATIKVPAKTKALHFHAAAWNNEDVILVVKQGDTELGSFNLYKDAGATSNSPFTLKGENYDTDQYYMVKLSNIEEETDITFTTTASPYRFILYGVNQEGGLTKELSAIEVSGTPDKLQYTEGAAFDPTGLTVKGTFKFGDETLPDKEDVTAQVTEWVVEPETLASTTTSVNVVAKVGEIASEPYTVENVRVLPENTDIINASTGTATTSTYKEFTATGLTNTQYAGKTALNDGNLTLSNATTSHPGIVSTYTIGYIKSVKVTIADGNTHNLDVYGSHRAYQSAEDLYSKKNAIRGTKIGTLTASGVLDLSNEDIKYEFIGIRSEEGAIQIPEIQITWTPVEFLRISVADNIEGGTIDIDRTVATAEEVEAGNVQVTVDPTPNEGLLFDKLVIYNENGDNVTSSITIAESGLSFTMPDYSVKVGATFKSQPVTAISLDKSSITIDKNSTETLTASFLPNGAFTEVTWTSDNEDIATVEGGVVTGKGQGTTTITASCNDGALTATCTVTVNAQPEYVLVTDATSLQDGDVIVLGNAANNAVNGGYNTSKYLDKVDATITEGVLTSNDLMEITLCKTDAGWNLVTEQGHLGAKAAKSLLINDDVYTDWTISISGNSATISAGDPGRFLYNANSNSTRFLNYTSNTSQTMLLPEIYRLSNDTKKVVKLMDNNNVYAIYRVQEGNNVTLSVALPTGCTKGWIMDGKTYARGATIENVTADITLYALQDDPIEITGEQTLESKEINQGSTIIIGDGTETKVTISTESQETIKTYKVVVKENASVTIPAASDINNLEIMEGGTVTISENATLTVNNFVISSTMGGSTSGQVTGVTTENFTITGEAYYDVVLGDNGNPEKWHAFAVPFNVDALNGIYDTKDNKLTNEVNYAIMDYHGDVRAEGKYGWKKFRGIMTPGTFYLMTVDGERNTYRMKMVGGFSASSSTISVQQYAQSGAGQPSDAGWNGIANSQLENVSVDAPVQILDPMDYVFKTKMASECDFTVGTPFFYQADDVTTEITLVAANGSNPAPAPRMTAEAKNIAITFANESYTDRLYISATDEATNEYQIGRDLVKMTMTNTPAVPQIFAEAYGTKLSMIDVPMMYDEAVYALNLYAPANGEYTIGAAQVEGYEVFLTQYGSVIWNLSMSEATIELTKGNNTEYGLILKATGAHAPTDINTLNGQESVQKFLYNSNIYIIRENQKYNAQGIKIQ